MHHFIYISHPAIFVTTTANHFCDLSLTQMRTDVTEKKKFNFQPLVHYTAQMYISEETWIEVEQNLTTLRVILPASLLRVRALYCILHIT